MANLVKKTYKNPLWMNTNKTQVRVEVYSVFDDGTENESRLLAERSDDPGSLFQQILSKYDEQYIDKNSEDAIRKSKEIDKVRENERRAINEDRKKRDAQEKLFATKLEAFEIEEIKKSTNRAMKSRIRKAKTLLEVQIFAGILVMEEMRNNEQESTNTQITEQSTPDVGSATDTSSNESSGSVGDSQPTVEDF